MSPKLMTSKGVVAGKDMDECERVEPGRGLEPGEGGDAESGIGGDPDGRELSPGEASGAAVFGGRGEGPEASERGRRIESRAADEGARAGGGARAREVQRADRRAVWADAGRGASGERRRDHGAPRHAAPLDAGRRLVESGPETVAPSRAPGAQGAFRRAGATRWQFPPMVRGARPARLLDELGRRRDRPDARAAGCARNDLGGGRCLAAVDRGVRRTAGALYGLEKCLCAGAD